MTVGIFEHFSLGFFLNVSFFLACQRCKCAWRQRMSEWPDSIVSQTQRLTSQPRQPLLNEGTWILFGDSEADFAWCFWPICNTGEMWPFLHTIFKVQFISKIIFWKINFSTVSNNHTALASFKRTWRKTLLHMAC